MKILQITYNCLNLHQRCKPRLHSAKRHKVSLPSLARALPSKITYGNGRTIVYVYDASGGTGRKFEGTVENFASCLIIHEWFSHGVLYEGDHNKNHANSYKRQKADKNFIQRPQKNLDLLWKKKLANIRERRNDYEIFI